MIRLEIVLVLLTVHVSFIELSTALESLHCQKVRKSHTFSKRITNQTASSPSSMFRKSSFAFIVYILVSIIFANGKTPNGKANNSILGDKPPKSMDQTFNINNWGFGTADRKLLTEMKYKIDSLYEKSQGE